MTSGPGNREPKLLHRGVHLDFLATSGWEFVRRRSGTGVVGVIACTEAMEVVLVEQYRRPLGCQVIELPAGLVGDQGAETILEAAARELEEETGYRAGVLDLLWSGPSSAGLTDEVLTVVRARELVRVDAGGGVDDECIEVHLVPLKDLDCWLDQRESAGALVDLKVRLARQALEWTP